MKESVGFDIMVRKYQRRNKMYRNLATVPLQVLEDMPIWENSAFIEDMGLKPSSRVNSVNWFHR